jgi:formylglycine-generating enzyme required for sulfatase activity
MTINMFIPKPNNPYSSELTRADYDKFAPLNEDMDDLKIADAGGVERWIEAQRSLCGADSDSSIRAVVNRVLLKAGAGGSIAPKAQKFLRKLAALCSTDSDYTKFDVFIEQREFVKFGNTTLLRNDPSVGRPAPISKEKYERSITPQVESLGYSREQAEWLVWNWMDLYGIDVIDIAQREKDVTQRESEITKKDAVAKKTVEEAKERQRRAEEERDNALEIAHEKYKAQREQADNDIKDANIKRMRADTDIKSANEKAEQAKEDIDAAKTMMEQAITDIRDAKKLKDDADRATKTALEKRQQAERDIKDANIKRTQADTDIEDARLNREQADKDVEDARNFARKEFEDVKAEAERARIAAEEARLKANEEIGDALKEKVQARDSETNAIKEKLAAEQTATLKIAEAVEAQRRQKEAEKWQWRSIFASVAAILLAGIVSIYCIGHAGYANMSATTANAELAKYRQTFDERVAAATAKVEAKEAEAVVKFNSADRDHKQAKELMTEAEQALQKAMEEQKIANQRGEELAALVAVDEKNKNIAIEKERVAKETEERADAKSKSADDKLSKAEQIMQAAIKKEANTDNTILAATQKANERAAEAEKTARLEKERRMGVEAMIRAGAPLQFPLEEHEQNEEVRNQRKVQTVPVSNVVTPPPSRQDNLANPLPRTVAEIFRDVVWHWCLEKELGIEDESGNFVGEVTEKPRTGHRTTLQGSPFDDPKDYTIPLNAFQRKYLLAPTEATRELLENGMPNRKDWAWNDWLVFRTLAERNKAELSARLPAGHLSSPPHTYTYPNGAIEWTENGALFISNDGKIPTLSSPAMLDRRFMLSQTEVTQELWVSVMGNNPSRFNDASRPVENISWEDAQEFIAKLNEMKEKLGVPLDYEFTLPLEAEWELACRAAPTNALWWKLEPKSMTLFHTGEVLDSKQANIGNPHGGTSVVGKYPANAWGLRDMHGNVREWCQDALGYGSLSVGREYYGDGGDPIKEGRVPNIVDNFYSNTISTHDDFFRSLRGGSWSLGTEFCHSAYRSSGNPFRKHDDVGFRLCLAAEK